MNIQMFGDTVVVRNVPASYSIATDAAGVSAPAVQESPAQYAVYNTKAGKTPWGILAAGVAAWLYFK